MKHETTSETYCNSICYYLQHVRLDIAYRRTDLMRHSIDHIAAMYAGYVRRGQVIGNWKKHKLSCYASRDAIDLLARNDWSTKDIDVTLEHVIPVTKHIGPVLFNAGSKLSDQELIELASNLVIHCVITNDENKALCRAELNDSMPDGWDWSSGHHPWLRYINTIHPIRQNETLFQSIFALRDPLPSAHEGPQFKQDELKHRTGDSFNKIPMPELEPVPACESCPPYKWK